MLEKVLTFGPTLAISLKDLPFFARSIVNPASLAALSVHFRSTRLTEMVVAIRPEGAAGGDGGTTVTSTDADLLLAPNLMW